MIAFFIDKDRKPEKKKTYEIIISQGTQGTFKGIKCFTCGLTSWNEHDIKEKYCGNCHKFHED